MHLSGKARDYIAALPFAALLFVLWPLIGLSKALAGATIAAVFSSLLEQNWELRRDKTFWVVITALALIHIAAVWFIPFGRPQSGLVAVPIGFADYYAMSLLLRSTAKHFGNPERTRRG